MPITVKPKDEDEWLQLQWELGNLFNGAPVADEDMFAGRTTEVRRMLEANARQDLGGCSLDGG